MNEIREKKPDKISDSGILSFMQGKARLLCFCLFLVCLFVVFINNRYLLEDPLKTGITWEDVACCAAGSDGTVGVIDSLGSRVSIVSEDRKLIGSISSSVVLGRDLQSAKALTFSEDAVYILDLGFSDSGNAVDSQRILKYSLRGKKLGTVYESPEDAAVFISDIYWMNGKCYAAGMDVERPGEAVIGEISDGKFRELHRSSAGGSEIFSVSYNPENDSTCVITYDGKLIIADGDTVRDRTPVSGDVIPSRAVVNDYGYLVALDSGNDRLFIADSDGETRDIARTYASYVSEKDAYLVFADLIREEVSRYDSRDGSILVLNGAEYTFRYRAGVILTYVCLILAAAYLLAMFLKLVISIVVALKRKSWEEREEQVPDRITIKSMITAMMPTFLMCYIVAAFILASAVWNNETENARESLMDAAVTSMYITQKTVGGRFCEISSEKDYGGEAYNEILRIYEDLCQKSSGEDRSYGYYLFRFPDASQNVIAIVDSLGQYRTGEMISPEEQEGIGLAKEFGKARNGETDCRIYDYRNGMELLWATVPVMDPSGTIVGAAMFSLNYSLLRANIFGEIARSLGEMLILMAGFLFLLAEIRIGRSLAKLQLEIMRNGDPEHTLVESAHTIQVLGDVSKSISVVFFTLIAADITKKSGMTGAVLLALPFTIQTIASKAAKVALAVVSAEKSRKAMAAGALLQTAGAVIGILAVVTSGYVLLCVSAATLSIGSQVCTNRSQVITKMGKKITDRYDDLEYYKLIAPTIGTAIGAAFRTYFGNTAIFIILIVFSLAYILVMNLFIGNTTAAAAEKKDLKAKKEGLLNTARFTLRPGTLVWLLFVMLPVVLLQLMASYVLPALTGSMKASDIFIAAVTVIVTFITMYAMPYARNALKKLNTNVVYAVSMGLLSLLFLVYAKVSTLECFAVIILAISILTASVLSSRDRLLKNEIARSSLQDVGREPLMKGAQGLFSAVLPTVLSLFLQSGKGSFGLAMSVFLMLSAVLSLLVFPAAGDAVK